MRILFKLFDFCGWYLINVFLLHHIHHITQKKKNALLIRKKITFFLIFEIFFLIIELQNIDKYSK